MASTANSPEVSAGDKPVGDGGFYFEDFAVGQRFTGDGRTITDVELHSFAALSGDEHPLHTDREYASTTRFGAPLVHAPFGQAAFLGWHYRQGLSQNVEAMLDSSWQYLKPVFPGDELFFEMFITQCRRTSRGDAGIVGRHVTVRNQHGETVQEGTTNALVRARTSRDPQPDEASAVLFSRAWAKRLGERLDKDRVFTSATATWDGAIGLRCGGDEVIVRVYNGRVLSAGGRVPNGPTFSLEASARTWAELFTGPSNDFMIRVMKGAFSTTGSAYEYLRLTKAVIALIDCVRELTSEGDLS